MTAATAVAGPGAGRVNVRMLLAAASAVVAVALVVGQEVVRRVEATVCATLMDLFQLFPARSLGVAVLFPSEGRMVGFTVAPSCTAALLIAPFVALTGVLLLTGRVPLSRGLATVAVFAGVIFVVNQLRLLAIAGAMRGWGYETGYDRSHVLLGSVVSTIGVAGGLLLFLRMVVPRHEGATRG